MKLPLVSGRVLPLLLLLILAPPREARARNVAVDPTGSPRDYKRVREALGRLSPGDTLFLGGGVFDWSENVSDTTMESGMPGGMAIRTSRVAIVGRRGAILRGKLDSRGEPV